MFPTRPRAGLFSHLSLAAAALLLPLSAGWAQTAAVAPASGAAAPVVAPPKPRALTSITPAEIEAAVYGGTDLPAGQSALTAKVQILLDRAGISPGVVDGWRGGMSESAIMAFQRRSGLPMTGRMDHAVWELLQGYAAAPLTTTYTITEEDAAGLVDRIPPDEPLVPETAPTLPAQDEPEYPSDAVLPESLPGQAPGSVTLYPQAGQP